jgi:arylsulfatase A-like enzyme
LAAPLALLMMVGFEAGWMPAKVLRQDPLNLLHALAHLLNLSYQYLWAPLLYLLVLSVVEMAPVRTCLGPRVRATLHLMLAAAVAGHAHWVMTRYEGFAEDPWVTIVFAGPIAFFVAVTMVLGRIRRGWLTWALPLALLLLGVGTVALNHTVHKGLYVTFHVAVVELNLVLFGLAALHLVVGDRMPLPRRRWARVTLASVGLLVLGVLPFVSLESGKTARKYVHGKTFIGQARMIYESEATEQHQPVSRGMTVSEPVALALFEQHSGLPALPADFRLDDYDLLLITIDALRWDQTSLADPSLDTTPRLLEFSRKGAFNFSRAYAPSSTTLQSTGAILSMTHPAAAYLDIWRMTWAGRLRLRATTVPELLSAQGYSTFWVGHDHQWVFSNKIIGLEQGFDSRLLVTETKATSSARSVDARIATAAVAKLRELDPDERFFGWFFFVSPHAPYVVHDSDAAHERPIDRYRQEVRNADRQLGRVLDELDEQGRLENTIVIITSDHGEELGERGGVRHAKTVYEEVVHVPLLVRIPGVRGTRIDSPTSLTYLFPWLLLSTDGQARDRVLEVLREEVGPMMNATEGAVVVQLLGRNHEASGLILGDLKLVYDHENDIMEVYDLTSDPGETSDLMFADPESAGAFTSILERYLEVRKGTKHFRLKPKKRVWRDSDQKRLEGKGG